MPILHSVVNAPPDVLEQAVVNCMKADVPVYFVCDHRPSLSRSLGMWNPDLVNSSIEQTFKITLGMSKRERLLVGEEFMTHSMVITAVHIENEDDSNKHNNGQGKAKDKVVRYKIENSWGEEWGDKGWFLMTGEWFREHVSQVVIPREMVDGKWAELLDTQEPTIWDAWEKL